MNARVSGPGPEKLFIMSGRFLYHKIAFLLSQERIFVITSFGFCSGTLALSDELEREFVITISHFCYHNRAFFF